MLVQCLLQNYVSSQSINHIATSLQCFACYICDTTKLYTSDMASTAAAASATDADVEADTAATAVVVVGGSGAGGNAGAVSDGDGGKEEKQSSGGYRLGPDGTPASNEAYTTQQYWEARYDRYTNKLGGPTKDKDKDKAGKSECSNTFSLCVISEPSYEWLASFEALEELVKQHIKPSDRILMVHTHTPSQQEQYMLASLCVTLVAFDACRLVVGTLPSVPTWYVCVCVCRAHGVALVHGLSQGCSNMVGVDSMIMATQTL